MIYGTTGVAPTTARVEFLTSPTLALCPKLILGGSSEHVHQEWGHGGARINSFLTKNFQAQ